MTGAILHDLMGLAEVGFIIIIVSLIYASVTTVLILFGVNLPPSFSSQSSFLEKLNGERESKKSREELREYKKLFDEGLLTQEEFNVITSKLKKKML